MQRSSYNLHSKNAISDIPILDANTKNIKFQTKLEFLSGLGFGQSRPRRYAVVLNTFVLIVMFTFYVSMHKVRCKDTQFRAFKINMCSTLC